MTIGRAALSALLAVVAVAPIGARSQADPAALLGGGTATPRATSPPSLPTIVGVGMHLIKLDDVTDPESLDPSFTAQFLLASQWTDPRLAVAPGEPREARFFEEENALGELATIWQPD